MNEPTTEPTTGPTNEDRSRAAQDLLDRILRPAPAPFALLHRPGTNGPDTLEILTGETSTVDTLGQIPVRDPQAGDGDGDGTRGRAGPVPVRTSWR